MVLPNNKSIALFLLVAALIVVIVASVLRLQSNRRKQIADAANLSVEVKANSANIGIPGITKMYEGLLINRGRLPVRIRVCDAISDAMDNEVHVAHAIERWDKRTKRWTALWRIPEGKFCSPYPTGILEGNIKDSSLSHGESVSTGEIAIQASDNVQMGDQLRFVVFPYDDNETTSVPSAPFEVDEHPTKR